MVSIKFSIFLFFDQCRFDEFGKRINYTYDILEMTPDSQLVKVGSWGDLQRLQISQQSHTVDGTYHNTKNQ